MAASERRKLFARAEPQHPLTPLDLKVLVAIAYHRILTPPQAAAIAGLTLRAARNHLRNLFDHGLVQRFGVPRAAFADLSAANDASLLYGAAPTVYGLSKEGAALLVKAGLVEKEEVKDLPQYGPRNALFLAHEVQVRDVRVWLEKCRRAHGHEGVVLWKDGEAAWLGHTRPDAVFVYRGPGFTLVGLLEVDRGTERGAKRWQQKFAAYSEAFAGDNFEKLTGHKRGRVLITVPDVTRRDVIGAFLWEQMQKRDIPPDRFWLCERTCLETADLHTVVWRVPGRPALLPLVKPTAPSTEDTPQA